MSVKMRQEVERKIAKAFIKQAIAAGYEIAVNNGEEETKAFDNVATVLKAMFLTDEDYLIVFNGKDGERFGWVRFIYGNDGWDVISDYTTNLEHVMSEAKKISDHYAD